MFYANLNINVQFACIDYNRVSVGQCLKKVIWLKKNQNMRRKNATKPKTLKKFWYGLTKRPIKIYCRFSMKVNRYRHSSNSLYAKGLKTNKKRVGSQHYKHRTDPKIHSKSLYNNDKCIKNNRGNLKTLYHTVPKFSRLFHTKKKGIYKNDKCIKNNRKNKGQNQPPIRYDHTPYSSLIIRIKYGVRTCVQQLYIWICTGHKSRKSRTE